MTTVTVDCVLGHHHDLLKCIPSVYWFRVKHTSQSFLRNVTLQECLHSFQYIYQLQETETLIS